ncbi:MAG TPA: transposase, partial [Lachnospiraceae bacterium]|nr:transposase [Lachnospiraceae bacterium]
MLKSYKTEIDPTQEQIQTINRTIGTCRFVYNFYLAHNKETYEKEKKFVSGMDFSKWINNEFIPNNKNYKWIKEVSSKSVKQSIMNAEKAFKRFFKHQSGFPGFKKKGKSDVKMYFVKTDSKVIISCERHRIKIPTLGWVRLKEKGYIPTNSETHTIKSGCVSCRAGRYYASVLVEEI